MKIIQIAPERESLRRTTRGKAAPHTWKELRKAPEGGHPAGTVQKLQGAAMTCPQALLAASCARVDQAPGPEARRSPTEPRVPDPAKQPPGVSQYTPEHPAPDIKNHQCTDSGGYLPPAGSVVVGQTCSFQG